MVHGVGTEVVQRDDASDDWSESGRNSWIADIANVLLAFDYEMVNFRLEGGAHLGDGAGKIDEHAAGIDDVDAKAMGFEPASDDVEVGLRQAELFTEFLRGQPLMEIGRTLGLEFVEKLLERHFLLGRALQLEQHVVHLEIAGYSAAIVRRACFRTGVARQSDTIEFINDPGDSRASMQARFDLRL